jgi:hypothetical protein
VFARFFGVLSGHLDPANDGHLQSGQRERLVPMIEADVENLPAIPALESPSSFPTPPASPTAVYHLARVLALSGERQKILFKDNQKRQEEPQIPGKSVGRILPDHHWPLLT